MVNFRATVVFSILLHCCTYIVKGTFIHALMLIRTNTNVQCELNHKKCRTERSSRHFNCPKFTTTL